MNKKAQVTIFVIVAIILIAGIATFFYIKETKIKRESIITSAQLSSIKEGIQDCVELTATDAIRLLGLQGGYIIPPPSALETNFSTISYGYYLGRKVLPSIGRMQDELNLYVELSLPLCFERSNFLDWDITTRNVKSKARIDQNSVSLTVDYPLSVSKGSATYRVDSKYSAQIPIRLGAIHTVINRIIDKEIVNSESVALSYLTNLDYDIAVLPYSENVIVYSVTDSNSTINDVPYTFMFANRLR